MRLHIPMKKKGVKDLDYEKLMQDETFVKRVSGAADFGEVSKILREYGVEVTEEELRAAAKGSQGELDETDLDNVAGGMGVGIALKVAFEILKSLPKPKANPLMPLWP